MNPYQFFKANAGYSYDSKIETEAQGRARCARALAKAERQAREGGFTYRWSVDPLSSSADWIDHDENAEDPPKFADGSRTDKGVCGCSRCEPWQVWQCAMYNARGQIVASLHGIDFGRDHTPWDGGAYKRVVEAELALEGLTNEPQGEVRT